ncbi:ABC transporter permease [Streptomyces lateritius]|uniref:ABC transporter permease n=1 Tax=Streptomyces lateritius TaxID=67313 RepID=UPI0019C6A29A|nr:transporter [Streptomyces lateritius]
MAEHPVDAGTVQTEGAVEGPAEGRGDGPVEEFAPVLGGSLLGESWRTYRMVAGMWIRSTMTYRASFALTLFSSFTVTFFDFVVILLMFGQVRGLGGFSFPEVAFLYGTTSTSFGLADLTMGSLQRMGRRVRLGSLDTFLLRPVPVLAQVAADQFALRRLGRVLQGLLVLVWGLVLLDVEWTVLKVLLLPVMLVCGALIFSAVMVIGASALFWAQDAAEVTSSFTYGGNTLLQYPPSIFAQDLVRGVVYVVPLAFVNWVPALYILGRPAPAGVPAWTVFASPLVAVVCCVLAGLAWRAGLRSYRSTGS